MVTRDCCRRWNTQLLRDVAEALDAAGVRWWLDYGALLGWCVNGGLYWNDSDTDVGVLVEDRGAVEATCERLGRAGYAITYLPMVPGERWTFGDAFKVRLSERNKTACDVVFWTRGGGMLDRECWFRLDQFKGREMAEGLVFPTQRGVWEGVPVNLPANPEGLVAHRYGEGWRSLPAARHDGVER